jgi:cellulose synthase/poly-beta-1,6-N-acetylglucosamine synthase-like glycosyltransferase
MSSRRLTVETLFQIMCISTNCALAGDFGQIIRNRQNKQQSKAQDIVQVTNHFSSSMSDTPKHQKHNSDNIIGTGSVVSQLRNLSTRTLNEINAPVLPGIGSPMILGIYLFAFVLLILLRGALIKWVDVPAPALTVFLSLFWFRYLRLIVNLVAFLKSKPFPVFEKHTLTSADVSVIIPTVDANNKEFPECIRSICQNMPHKIFVVTPSLESMDTAARICRPLIEPFGIPVEFLQAGITNKRVQLANSLSLVRTEIAVLADDHVFWPRTFLRSILAPFAIPSVGSVGTVKRVRREPLGPGWSNDFFNFLGCLYLERHNFDLLASNFMDTSVFVISGRTSAHRARILKDENFLEGFCNESVFFGWFGPLNADDDNFIVCWMVRHGWDIVFQSGQDATMETTLGEAARFQSQCLRWVRTTWRSNSASLFTDRSVWRRQPWGVYTIHLTSLVNFALFYDAALFFSLWRTVVNTDYARPAMCALASWIFLDLPVETCQGDATFLTSAQGSHIPPCIYCLRLLPQLHQAVCAVNLWRNDLGLTQGCSVSWSW